jgi:hypothetical protein
MRQRPVVGLFTLMLVSTFYLAYAGQPEPSPGDQADRRQIEKLIAQLGDDSFVEREAARKELELIGPPALPGLRKALQQGDLELSRRAAELIRVIEERSLSADLLKPKKVHLKVEDMPVLEAVAKLAKISGYAVRVDGDRTMLGNKRITLDTGEVTFWEALDKLNEKAGLAEKLTVASQPGDFNGNPNIYTDFLDIRVERALIRAERKPKVRRPPPPPLKVMKLPKKGTGQFDDRGNPIDPDAKPEDKKPDKPQDKPDAKKEILDRLDALIALEEAQTKEIQGEIRGGGISLPALPPTPPPPAVRPGRVVLVPTTSAKQYVSYAGAARVTLKHPKAKPQPGSKHYDLILEVSAEPRLLGFTLNGVPAISKALDEHGQPLSFLIDPPAPPKKDEKPGFGPPGVRVIDIDDFGGDSMFGRMPVPVQPSVTVRLQPGDKPAKRLKELSGSLSAHVLVPDSKLAQVDNVLKAKGKATEIKGGGRMVIDTIEKLSDTDYNLTIKLENLPANANPGQNYIVNGNRLIAVNGGAGDLQPMLVDAKGKQLALSGQPGLNNEQDPMTGVIIKTTVNIRFHRDPGQGEPTSLVLQGTYLATVAIPFRFTDVPLP